MKTLKTLAMVGLTLASTSAFAQEVAGPKVNWSLSMWGPPRALSSSMEAIADSVEEATAAI